ncbi:MAG: dicarboxylate/amino acid:cation symporter [Bacteroidales bacterium]|jgi:Na+/H+-dicarboxylate symporter|nr:dicarboxylate/amino acid:cation symporter [Bacteroidales bacterium]
MVTKKKFAVPLYWQIMIGMGAGIAAGITALKVDGIPFIRDWIYPWGKLFIVLLQMIAIPLVFVTLVKGVLGLKDISSFSRLGGRAIFLYLATTIIAVMLGLALGLTVKPGNLVNKDKIAHIQEQYKSMTEEKENVAHETSQQGPLRFIEDIIPANIVAAATDNSKMLQVIFFALFFGLAAITIPAEKVKPVAELMNSLNDIILRMVDYIIRFAPYGVAALMAGLVVDYNGEAGIFSALAMYALLVVAALLIMMFVFYPLLIRFFTKITPGHFIKTMFPVQLFAFTTSSSSSTLPVNLHTVEKRLGVSKDTTSFILPVGTTVNMDGTSCYQTIAVLFIAQALGIDLTVEQLLTIIGMTVISSIGTPGIPGGSFVILMIVLTSVGIPADGLALILGIDRPLDMLRTSVNVTGDATVAAIIDNRLKRQPA